jgi:hypothetical protein
MKSFYRTKNFQIHHGFVLYYQFSSSQPYHPPFTLKAYLECCRLFKLTMETLMYNTAGVKLFLKLPPVPDREHGNQATMATPV